MRLGWPSVEMMLDNLSVREYVDWIAFFSIDPQAFDAKQSIEQMQANLGLITAKKKRKKT